MAALLVCQGEINDKACENGYAPMALQRKFSRGAPVFRIPTAYRDDLSSGVLGSPRCDRRSRTGNRGQKTK